MTVTSDDHSCLTEALDARLIPKEGAFPKLGPPPPMLLFTSLRLLLFENCRLGAAALVIIDMALQNGKGSRRKEMEKRKEEATG